MRYLVALFAGGLFGAGLLLSGMTDTLKVQGFLDIFGSWDPTLAFVMGGAILPMTLAWALARRRPVALLGTPIQTRAEGRPDRSLVIGSVLFGVGWGLAGLCPGPAIASIGFGGTGGLAFLLAMMAGMIAARPLRQRLSGAATATMDTERQRQMDIRQLTPGYAVSPQITPDDIPAIKAAGFTRVICNRPDGEIPPALHAARMRALVESAGLEFVENQVLPGDFSDGIVAAQRAAIDSASGPVFAYCASGNRCSVVWALGQAGRVPGDELIATAARWGYNLEPFRARLG
jgi:uncharacterized protein (TIGR01244 family)